MKNGNCGCGCNSCGGLGELSENSKKALKIGLTAALLFWILKR